MEDEYLQSQNSAFAEERNILLKSAAQSISRIVEKLDKVNENIIEMKEGCEKVKQLAEVWKEFKSGEEETTAHNSDIVEL
mmetsp:Transcript_24814/g.36720  ORF Transcript_24814/g.36720 Transcript_24814/m.36720 type:complete len:80 (+) Transcript_24814:106-345(+)